MTKPTKEKIKEEKEIDEIDRATYELPDPSKIEIDDPIVYVLTTESESILEDDYVNDKVIQEKAIQQIKDEYNFDDIKDAFDERKIPPTARIFFGGDNDNFVNVCNFLFLNEENKEFISFLCSDTGQNIMINKSLSINIESGDIFYNYFNTKKNFYNFLPAQEDESKQFILKRISYYYSFEKYMRNCLPSFSIDEIEKLDMLSNKNGKYLPYKFNDWIETLGAEKLLIRHSSNVSNIVGLQKKEKKDKQFLIEKNIYEVEKRARTLQKQKKSQKSQLKF